MDVELELHAPGLDMNQSRWTHHLIFMQEVHERKHEITAISWEHYQSKGRGSLFVDRKQWMDVIRDTMLEESMPFPCSYVTEAEAASRFDFNVLTDGFVQVLHQYDPETRFVLTVEHHPEGLLSTYLVVTEPGPRETSGTE
ncbi:MAG: hypothetical protein ACR2GR_06635 [Rhodothermales bacterium]